MLTHLLLCQSDPDQPGIARSKGDLGAQMMFRPWVLLRGAMCQHSGVEDSNLQLQGRDPSCLPVSPPPV